MVTGADKDLLVSQLIFWDKLTDEQQELLTQNTELLSIKKGQTIMNCQDECVGVLIVKSGELRAFLMSEDGREITLFRMDAGEVCVLTASCVLHHVSFDVQIDVQKDSKLLRISPFAFSRVVQQNLHAENYSLSSAVQRFSDVVFAIQQIMFMSFDKRLVTFLLSETDRAGTDNIIMTHEQIARYIGSAREVVSRMLKYFEREGLVRLRRGGVQLRNRDGLIAIVGKPAN